MWWVSGKNKSFVLQIQCDSLDSNCFQFLTGHILIKLGLLYREQNSKHGRALASKLCSAMILPGFTQPRDGTISGALRIGPVLALPFPQSPQSVFTPSLPCPFSIREFFLVTYLNCSHSQALRSFLSCFSPAALDPPSSRCCLTPCSSHPHLFYNNPFWYLPPFLIPFPIRIHPLCGCGNLP